MEGSYHEGLCEFLKTTALGGLFVVLPVLLLYLLLGEILDLVIGLVTPIADLFPKGTFDNLTAPFPVAVILIVGVSFVIGLAMRVEVGRGLGDWIERKVLGRLPLYSALKSLTKAFGEAGEGALLSIWFFVALSVILEPIGLPAAVLPMVMVVWIMLLGAQTFGFVQQVPLTEVTRPEDHLKHGVE